VPTYACMPRHQQQPTTDTDTLGPMASSSRCLRCPPARLPSTDSPDRRREEELEQWCEGHTRYCSLHRSGERDRERERERKGGRRERTHTRADAAAAAAREEERENGERRRHAPVEREWKSVRTNYGCCMGMMIIGGGEGRSRESDL
jgi:hypothetical protein